MDDKNNETLADIVAEMRANAKTTGFNGHIYWDAVADRIKAAAERERIQRDKVSFRCGDCANFGGDCDAGAVDGNEDCIACGKFRRRAAPGSASAMREALEDALCALIDIGCGKSMFKTIAKIRAALAAPPRNCDRFDNYSSAKDYFLENELWKYNHGLTPEYWFGVWLLSLAEKEARYGNL